MKELIKTADCSNLSTLLKHPYFFHLALLRIDQVGPLTFNKCRSSFKTPQGVFEASKEQLKKIGLKETIIKNIKLFYDDCSSGLYQTNSIYQGVRKDIEWLQQANHFLVAAEDSEYPSLLKEIYDYPPLLFVIGNLSLLTQNQIAIVGSRRPSKMGVLDAKLFSKALCKKGLVITSGLASGIDSHAHEGAIVQDSESTIAVLAHGLDGIYPKRNQSLAAKIINSGGALVSEFPVGVVPRPEYFPRRNRIISGLSLGVLVVEAAVKSGSLITAYCALEQNREVFAIPGSIHNPVARGCHKLIKDGAKLVENSEDITVELIDYTYEYNVKLSKQGEDEEINRKEEECISLKGEEKNIFRYLNHDELDANEIAAALALPVNVVAANLTLLELKGLAIQGEKGFIRKAKASSII